VTRPIYAGDLYSKEALRDPYPEYKIIRDLGAAAWMPERSMWVISRYDDVRSALRADQILVSGRGVAANDLVNNTPPPITLSSDGDVHARRRLALIQPLLPPRLKDLRARLEEEADRLVQRLATGEAIEVMSAFASHLPLTVVAELVGLDEGGRRQMLRWAAATFDVLGVMNERGMAALPHVMELQAYIAGLSRESVIPGGWAALLFDAIDRGDLSREEASAMVIDYVGPALDTTILATGHMVWLLSTTPGAYEALRAEPDLVPSVVNEAVRLASPIRGFTRYAMEDYPVGDIVIPKESRVLILYASANHDERHYPSPHVFDVRRNPRDHVAWGHGAHTCAGMHLARLEMEVLLSALLRHVERVEVGTPKPAENNVLQGFEALPARFYRAA